MPNRTDVPAWTEPLARYRGYMVAAGRSGTTLRLRLHYLGRFAADFPAGPWQVEPGKVIEWLAAPDWSPETRKSARSSIAGFYRWGYDFGHTGTDVARLLPKVRVPRALPRPAPDAAFSAALEAASDRDRLMLLLAALAGLRRAEITCLQWSAVGPDSLHIVGKGGRHRIVPLAPELAAALDAVQQLRAAGKAETGWRFPPDTASRYVFPGGQDGHIHTETVGQVLKDALGDGLTGHQLRHRFATRAYAGTHDLRAVQQLLGHESPVTTMRYTAVADDQLLAAVRAAAASPIGDVR